MKHIFSVVVMLVAAFLCNCATVSTASQAVTTKSKQFSPEQVWHNSDQTVFAISGYHHAIGGIDEKCYVLIPKKRLDGWKNEKGEVLVSKIRPNGLSDMKLIRGQVPPGFVHAAAIASPGNATTVEKTTEFHPQRIPLLPFTLVVDVLTLPLQIAAARALDFM